MKVAFVPILSGLAVIYNASCALQGSATLSMAYAGALFADACLRGLNGEPNVEEYSYVESDKTELPFFSTKVKLGTKGTSCLVSQSFILPLN